MRLERKAGTEIYCHAAGVCCNSNEGLSVIREVRESTSTVLKSDMDCRFMRCMSWFMYESEATQVM